MADVERHRLELEKFSVETHLSGDENNPTGTIVIIVQGEDRTMLTDRGANVIFDLDTIPDELIADAEFLHFTGHTVIDEPKRQAVTRIIKRAKKHGITISFDPATAGFIEDFGVEDFLQLCDGIDILRPNEDEARVLSGLEDPAAASQHLTKRFPLVVTTCGREGVYVAERGKEVQFFTVAPVKVVDPTGAGDSFNAGLLDGLARGLSPLESAKHAAVVASEGLTRFGARPS
jgi:sugar/nucleoside kinase (ribokinase family)